MADEQITDETLRRYEGLIFKTASIIGPRLEDDPEDVRQVLRIKVWQALVAYDGRGGLLPDARGRTAQDRYVFMCVRNQVKDLFKKKRQNTLAIEDLVAAAGAELRLRSRDNFEEQYLSSSPEEVYGGIEDDDVLVPSTLTQLERQVVVLLYRDFRQAEVARSLGLDKRAMERVMKSIRAKMADWRPTPQSVGDELSSIAA